MPNKKPKGYVYVLSNPTMDGLLKIGYSQDPNQRRIELNTTGVPRPFVLEYCLAVANAEKVERGVHKSLRNSRLSMKREFFRTTINDAVDEIRRVSQETGNAIKTDDEFFPNLEKFGASDFEQWAYQRKAEVKENLRQQKLLDQRKRRYEKIHEEMNDSLISFKKEFWQEKHFLFFMVCLAGFAPVPFVPMFLTFALDEVLSGALAKDDVLLIGFFATPYVGFVAVFIFYKIFWSNQTLMNPTFVHTLIAMKFRKLPTSGRLKVFEQQVKELSPFKKNKGQFLEGLDYDYRVCPYCVTLNQKPSNKHWYQAKCGSCKTYLGP